MSCSTIKKDKKSDRIYYNVTIRSLNIDYPFIPARFNEQLNEPIIDAPEDYYLAVVRYRVPTQTIPIFTAQIQPYPNTLINNTVYSVTLSLAGADSQKFVQFVPSQLGSTVIPPSPATPSNPNYPNDILYYYVYSYQQFLDMINTTLAAALTALPGVPGGQLPPYFQYNANASRIELVAQRQYYDNNVAGTTTICVNDALFSFLTGFSNKFLAISSADGKDRQIIVENTRNNFYQPSDIAAAQTIPPAPAALPDYYLMVQEYNSLADWNTFVGLSLQSNSLPCKTEFIPVIYQGDAGTLNGEPVISDIEPFIQFGSEARTNVQFFQNGPYKLVNMYGRTPLTRFDVQLYWTDIYGNVTPLYLSYNRSVTIKFEFIRKDSFTS